jgi:hypothetical protein
MTDTAWWELPDSPDCPTCGSSDTGWDGISADYDGDWWTCGARHRFIFDHDGHAYVPATSSGTAS